MNIAICNLDNAYVQCLMLIPSHIFSFGSSTFCRGKNGIPRSIKQSDQLDIRGNPLTSCRIPGSSATINLRVPNVSLDQLHPFMSCWKNRKELVRRGWSATASSARCLAQYRKACVLVSKIMHSLEGNQCDMLIESSFASFRSHRVYGDMVAAPAHLS